MDPRRAPPVERALEGRKALPKGADRRSPFFRNGRNPARRRSSHTLIPSGTGLHIAFANAVNNAGQIAATAFDAQGRYHAVLLTPGEGPPPTPTVSIADVSVTEGTSGTRNATFWLTISPMPSNVVTVAYSTANGTAVAGSDYDAAAGTLTIPAGRTSWAISVTVRGDRKREPDETFFVNLSGATGATIADRQGQGTILNDDR